MIAYVHSPDGESVNSGISIEPRDGWTPCVYEPLKSEADEVCVCIGFVKDGDSFRATFEKFKVEDEEELTIEDKDAALRRFGVEV